MEAKHNAKHNASDAMEPERAVPLAKAGVTVRVDRGDSPSDSGDSSSHPRTDTNSDTMPDDRTDRKRATLERLQTLRHAGLATDPEVTDPDAREDELLAEVRKPWIHRKGNLLKVVLNVLSVLVIAAGIVLATPVSPEQLYAFRWPIFFGAIIPFYYVSKLLTNKIYHWIEVIVFKEPLFHFRSVKKSTKTLVFFLLVLLWYFMVFELLWCRHTMYRGVCKEPAYVEVTRTMMKIILCCTLASTASFLAALFAKLVSTHFLKSTHFKKLHMALEKEHYLKILSDPKLRRLDERHHPASDPPGAAPSVPGSLRQHKPPSFLEVLTEGTPMKPPNEGKPKHRQSHSLEDFDMFKGHSNGKTPGKGSRRSSYEDLTALEVNTDTKSSRASTDGGASSGASTPTASAHEHQRMLNLHNGDDIDLQMGMSTINAVQLEFLAEERDVASLSEEEIDRLRTAVVIKTGSSMMRQHKFRTKEEKEAQLQRTQEFAKLLFYTIKGPESRRPYITYHDVKLFFPDSYEGKRDARSAFNLFAHNRGAKVYRQQVVDTVMAIYKDRSNISASLSNTETMIRSLQGCLAVGLHFLFLAFYLLIWQIDLLTGFSTFSTTVLALSFIFGNSIRNLFESMLFLFVEHPYDIGDWVEIDGKCYEVVKISIMNTTFYATGMVPTTIPNATLIPKEIRNMTRLDTHLEIMTIQVDFGMAEVVKDEIRQRLVELTKQFSSDYNPAPIWVVYTGVDTNMKANLLVLWTYACAPADWDKKHPARDRAVKMVTGIVAKHHSNGASYTFSHRLANGVPADLLGMASGGAGNNANASSSDIQAAAAALHAVQHMQAAEQAHA